MKADNVIQSFRPLTYISWLSFAPFQFNRNAKNKVYISLNTFVCAIVYYLLYFVCCVIISSSWITLITISTIFGLAIIKRQKLVSIMQNIIFIDEILVRLGRKMNYQRILRINYLTCTVMVILNFIYLGVQIQFYSPLDFIKITVDTLFYCTITLLVSKFVGLTHLARSLFSKINEVLQDILEAHTEQNTDLEVLPIHSGVNGTSVTCQDPEYAVKQISIIHNLLCDMCEMIEEYFTYPLLVTIAISILIIIFGTFLIVVAMFNPAVFGFKSNALIAASTSAIIFLVIIFIIVETSSRTTSHCSSCAVIAHKILNTTDDLKLKDRMFHLSLQLTNRRINFTAAGLISLDRTLILTVLSFAICYVIILAQFYPEYFQKKT